MKKGIILLALLLMLPQALMAADADEAQDAAALKEFRLDQVTVYGESADVKVLESAVNVIMIDEDVINSTPADNLSELLQQQGLGVLRAANNDGNDFVVLRGYRSDHLGKELDGRTLILINGRRTGAGSPNMIPVLNIERIEILRGPDMLPYSAAASGGVINIVTKRATANKPFSITAEGGVGSYGYWNGSVVGNGIVDNFDFSFGYKYTTVNDYRDGRGDRVYYTKDDGVNNLMASVGYTFLDTHRIGISYSLYDVNKAYKPASTDAWGMLHEAKHSDRRNQVIDLMYDGSTRDERWSWNLAYSYGENYSKAFSANGVPDPTAVPPMGSWYDTQTGQASLTYRTGLFEIMGGGQFYIYEAAVSGAGTVPKHDSSTTYNYAGFLLGKLRLFDDTLIISGGARYDYYKVTDDWFSHRNANTRNKKRNTTFDDISPSIGAAYMPLDWFKVRANYTRGFRPPSGRELVEDTVYGFWGNPELKAEHSDTYEAGFDLMFDWFNFSATYFYSYTKDYIYQHADDDPYYQNGGGVPGAHQRVQNSDKQVRSGLEIQVTADVAKFAGWDDFEISPYFNLNHLFRAEEKYRGNKPWTDLNWIPMSSFSTGLRFKHKPSAFMFNVNWTQIGKAYTTKSSKTVNTGSYNLVNLSMQKRLFDFDGYGELSIKANVTNLFDEKYYAFGSTSTADYYMPGRSVYVGMVYSF